MAGETPAWDFVVQLDEPAIRRAVWAHLWGRVRISYVVSWVVVGVTVATRSIGWSGVLGPVVQGVTTALAVLLVLIPAVLWRATMQAGRGWLELTEGRPVRYRADAEGLWAEYATGSGMHRWRAFGGVRKLREFWLLSMRAQANRVIGLPVAQVPPGALAFIEEQIAAAQGAAPPADVPLA